MDFWIKVLRIASEYGEKGFLLDEMIEKVCNNEHDKALLIEELDRQKTYFYRDARSGETKNKYILNIKGAIALLEYEQLQQAREAAEDSKSLADESLKKADDSIVLARKSLEKSEKALYFTKWAVGIAIVTLLASICLSIVSLCRPVETILIEDRTSSQVEETVERPETPLLENINDTNQNKPEILNE
jgi:hypothetical protein